MSVIIAAGVSQDRFAGLMEEIDKLNNSSVSPVKDLEEYKLTLSLECRGGSRPRSLSA